MAENVQYNLENSLKELEQMKRVGLFSESEIRKIIKKRKVLEYKIAKLFKKKDDYLKFIQYELALLSLVRLRREKLRYFHKKTEIDNSIGKRINALFKAAIKRFPDDLKLWFSHHDFLKRMHWVENMTAMHTRMLQIHNKSPELWVTCAKWELEDNNSIDNARKLFQRALRFHPKSEHVWKEYFRLELLYVDQLLKRRQVLGIEQVEDEKEDKILNGQIAEVVYQNAIKSIADVVFPLTLLPVCKEFDFTQRIQEMIYTDIEERYPETEETWNALALRCMDDAKNDETSHKRILRSCIENSILKFEEAVTAVPTEKMWDLFIQFILERIQESTTEKRMAKLVKRALSVMQLSADAKLLSRRMYIEWIRLLFTLGNEGKAHEVVLSACQIHPTDTSIWQFCLILHSKTDDNKAFPGVFTRAIASVPQKDSLPLWQIALEWATCNKFEHLQNILEKGLTQGPEVQMVLKQRYIELTALIAGVDDTRSLYQRLRKLPPLSLDFFESMISVEESQVNPDIKKIRKCYEDAVENCGHQSVDIWLKYMKLESYHPDGRPVKAGKLYWRALKCLRPELSDEFIRRYTLEMNAANEDETSQNEHETNIQEMEL